MVLINPHQISTECLLNPSSSDFMHFLALSLCGKIRTRHQNKVRELKQLHTSTKMMRDYREIIASPNPLTLLTLTPP